MSDLNVTAILHWSESVYTWIGESETATDLPEFVVRHFVDEVPALVVEIQHLRAELAAADQMLDVLTAEETR